MAPAADLCRWRLQIGGENPGGGRRGGVFDWAEPGQIIGF